MGSFDDLYFYEKKAPEKQALPGSSTNPPINYNDVRAGSDISQQTAKSSPGTVYLDIGHCTSGDPFTGKRDMGFQTEGYNECQINTAVGKRLANELQKDGFRVVSTWIC